MPTIVTTFYSSFVSVFISLSGAPMQSTDRAMHKRVTPMVSLVIQNDHVIIDPEVI